MDKHSTLRAMVLAAERVQGADQLRALANLRAEAQRLEDELLLSLLEVSSQGVVAKALGISQQAVSLRAKHARTRAAQWGPEADTQP